MKAASVQTAMPSIRSEWPEIYFVAALIDTSTPCFSGWKQMGEAQVLSMIVVTPRWRQSFVMAGTSVISNVSEPGDSM